MAERKLKAWVAAGLIDDATADRIGAYEAEHARPVALWTVVGIGGLSVALGVISLVAANWDAIAPETRLALHAAVMVALGLWLASAERTPPAPAVLDAALLVFAGLGLAFLGHVGQVYQTSAAPWQAIALWFALFAPLLLARGQGWGSASLLVGGAIALAWMRADDPWIGSSFARPESGLIRSAAECGVPVWFLPLAAWAGLGKSLAAERQHFWHHAAALALGYALVGCSLLMLAAGVSPWRAGISPAPITTALLVLACVIASAGGLLCWVDRSPAAKAIGAILGLVAFGAPMAYWVSGSMLGAGLLFLGLWSAIGAAALYGQNRALFQLATTLVTVRLIILGFEASGGLLMSGVGLIVGGAVAMALAYAAYRLSRAYAPAQFGER